VKVFGATLPRTTTPGGPLWTLVSIDPSGRVVGCAWPRSMPELITEVGKMAGEDPFLLGVDVPVVVPSRNVRSRAVDNVVRRRLGHRLEPGSRLPEVSPNDKTVAYVRAETSNDEITPDTVTLIIEELASRQVLRTIELPCKPKELRFIAGGQTVMTIFELTARQHRRNVALLYGVQPNDMDGETISWTPCPD